MANNKYRVNEVAKDFGLKSKDVLELLEKVPGEQRKHMTALNDEELNYIFETYTQQNEVKDFNAFFSDTQKAEKEVEKEPKTEKTAKPAKKEQAVEATPAAKDEEKPQSKEEKKAEAKKEEAKQPTPAEKPAPKAEPAASRDNRDGQRPQGGFNRDNRDGQRPQGGFSRDNRDGQRPQGGFNRDNRDGQRPQGGFSRDNRDSQRPQGGFNRDNRDGQRPQGGFNRDNRDGQRPQGGFNRDNRDGQRPQGGFNRDNRDGQRPQGGFNRDNRDGQRPQGGFNRDNRDGQRPQGGFNRDNQANQQVVKPNVSMPKINMPTAAGNAAKQQNKGNNVAVSKTQIEMKTVDTRTVDVNLDKYNEKYEQIASAKGARDVGQTKQKINQKSARSKQANSRRETEAEKLKRLQQEREKKPLKITIGDEILVGELASRLKVTASEVIKRLMMMGVMANVSQVIDYDTAALVAMEMGAKVEKEVVVTIEERLIQDVEDTEENLEERSPVVVVMGHVDHGKTSLLDAIRNANVTSTEAGGITQHIGAYRVSINDKPITFLDTPGHAAFTSMRARGAQITDIAILVVAADDGIMPQTVEAINHAKAAGVSIIVAINKMDKPEANPDRVKQELTEHELVPEEWGGDVICVPVSAKTHDNIDTLLEMVLLVAEVKELKANPNRLAKGTVIEAKLDKGRGPVATILVQNGTLHTGDIVIAGTSVGRVRVMTDDKGRRVNEAGPSVPVEITGLDTAPSAGDIFNAVEDERLARELVEQRKQEAKEEAFKSYQKVTLDNLFSQIAEGEMKELPIIVKADVQGSVEAVKQSLEKLSNEEVRVRVIHGAVGAVSESDVMLARASNAIIVGFNVRPDPVAKENAERDGVDVRLYRIIYDAIEEIQSAMKGMLAPKFRDVEHGRIEIRTVYKISNVGAVAGCYVLNGKVLRSDKIRVVRDGIIIADDQMSSLKRFKDDVKEVAQGYECGITLMKFNDFKEGDIFESYEVEEYRED